MGHVTKRSGKVIHITSFLCFRADYAHSYYVMSKEGDTHYVVMSFHD